MDKIRCSNCKFKSDTGDTNTTGKAFCQLPGCARPFDLCDECHFQGIEVNLKDFRYVINGDLPDDFEVCLIVGIDGRLSAGCWDTGTYSQEGDQPGAFRQSRGGSISLDSVWAWLPIEKYKVTL